MDGEVMYHEFVHKTEEEVAAIKKRREEKRYVLCSHYTVLRVLDGT